MIYEESSITANVFGLCVRWRFKPQVLNLKTNIDMSTNDELKNETANGTKPVLYDVGAKRKYYYIEEITSCVICGREKRYRQRVYEKPEPHLRVNWKEDACSTHFI